MKIKFLITTLFLFSVCYSQAQPLVNTDAKGFIVTLQGDTIQGSFIEFHRSMQESGSVVFISATDDQKKPMTFFAKDIKSCSSEGLIYETIYYFKNGAFSGWQTPGDKLMLVLYASPSIKFYFFQQAGEFAFLLNGEKECKYYEPFSRNDATGYLKNFNKKLGSIFSNCDAVKQKIQSGEYELKKDGSTGHIRAVEDFERNCGCKEFDKYSKLSDKESVIKLYR